ncbi:hypothetical protein GPECTOR_24g232 [Gonium pectorale]|uniref:Uncharacterized protein n=1 Tax=Gonium pectorale TaxID=33097 RepID=A0A150GGI1_GONPE|nr:hypothetical protein GPECTOR_24g232 [Gonium pectorale]|eukprot:KXZ48942.1 hypothetical protein GPECTOR_24g232 [Gonium pectorale]
MPPTGFLGWLSGMLDWLRSLFFKREMELSLVGLNKGGKSTLVNVLTTGQYTEDTIPTAIVFVVDSADVDSVPAAARELHALLEKPSLKGIPLLVLGNKNDLKGALGVTELSNAMNLKSLADREVAVYSISCKSHNNIDVTLQWLTKHARA